RAALALVAAVAYGVADFLAGLTARRARYGLVGFRCQIAGVGFAVLFIALGLHGTSGFWWPVMSSQLVGSSIAFGYVLSLGILRRDVTIRAPLGRCMLVGLLNACATLGFYHSSALGSLSISSLLTAMYSAVIL